MIRSSKHSLKFCNKEKKESISFLVDEYRKLLQDIVDDFWLNGQEEAVKLTFIPSEKLNTYSSMLSSRLQQACGKQALMMLKSALTKRNKQIFVLKKLQRENKNVHFLQSKIDRQCLVKPNCGEANVELDSRFIDFKEKNLFTFIRISSIGQKKQIRIPIKETKVSLKWSSRGIRKSCIRLSKTNLFLIFDSPNSVSKGKEVLGADQGIASTLSLSNGISTSHCVHGHNLQTILKKLSRKKSGSKGFAAASDHRKNYINWSLNQLDLSSCKELRLEKLFQVGKGYRKSRFLSHWNYTMIKDKLIRLGETEGFDLVEVPNEFRSQRCSSCGWVRKANRKGKMFKCSSCSFTHDADLNAASNLSLDLFKIPFWVRLKKINRNGFFWKPDGLFSESQECIVPDIKRANEK